MPSTRTSPAAGSGSAITTRTSVCRLTSTASTRASRDRDLVLARIIEPVSKLDSLRVLEEAGITPASYRTAERRLPAYAQEEWRQRLSEACAAHARLGPAGLVFYDVSTLYFETDQGDGFREPGSSKSPGWPRSSGTGSSP